MTKKLNGFRFGAVTATASVAAGLAAMAFVVKLETDPLAFTTPPPETQSIASNTETGDWVAPIAQAMVNDAKALRSTGPRINHAPTHAVAQATPTEATCVSHWESLEMGPIGRHYAVLCQGEPILALPPPNPNARASTKIELPSPTQLARNIEGTPLPSDLQPSSQVAEQAGRTVDQMVSRRSSRAEAKHPSDLPDQATQIPYVDPLGWSISSKAFDLFES